MVMESNFWASTKQSRSPLIATLLQVSTFLTTPYLQAYMSNVLKVQSNSKLLGHLIQELCRNGIHFPTNSRVGILAVVFISDVHTYAFPSQNPDYNTATWGTPWDFPRW